MRNSHSPGPPDIDFAHLRTFLTLARLGNFSRTGQHVGLSQSAVSRHVRALEDTLGLRLFQRLGRRAVLTAAGQTLRTRMETLMREAESLPRVIRDLAKGVQGDIRIGASITAAHAILPPLLGAYRRRYPRVGVTLKPGDSADMLETLARGETDLAFVGSDALPPGTSLVAEIPDQVVFIAPRAHPLAGRRVSAADLAGCEFIQRDAASDTRALVGRWFQAQHVQPRIAMEVGWPEIVKRLVGASIGVSALSDRLVREELARGTVKPVKVAGWPLRRQIRIVQLKDAVLLKAVEHFFQLARKRIPAIRFVEGTDAARPDSQREIRSKRVWGIGIVGMLVSLIGIEPSWSSHPTWIGAFVKRASHLVPSSIPWGEQQKRAAEPHIFGQRRGRANDQ